MDIKNKVEKISIDSHHYPEPLKNIYNPPKELYAIGEINLLKNDLIAVVGARKASSYGLWAAKELGKRFAQNNVVTVSGLAAGIDSMGHKGALSEGGHTIAVLGSGIDICFPAFNKGLMNEIAKKGLILSEYPPGYPASKYTFPQRNRIISGISKAVVVVEAGLNSGSLITAERAIEQGKTVFCIPGNINSIYSLGTNKLIQDGANILAVIDDIFDMLSINKKKKSYIIEQLGEKEKKIINALISGGEISIDYIAQKTDLNVSEVNALVSVLEIKGLVYSAMGKIFIAN
ncbi:MAG: DNA-processing protein DprA [Aminipila sp.]